MAKPLSKTVVVAYGRSAVAKSGKKGALRNLHPIDMGGLVLKGVMEKIPKLDPALVEDVILGCAIPEAKQGLNPARLVAARAGLPYTACGLTVDRFCSSSLQAVALAAWQIEAGQADCIVAGGIESMTALPMTLDRSGDMDPWLLEHDPAQYISNGETAENVAEKYNVTREEMDRLALESHRKAAAAQDAGYFDEQIIPLPGVDAEGNEIVFDKDQGIRRDTTLEKMASMKPCFRENGRVTAATSSQTSDGAAFLVLMSRDKAAEMGIRPLASFLGFCVGGLDPAYMGLGPIYAAPKVLEYTGLTMDDMDVIELNEAFAAQGAGHGSRQGQPQRRRHGPGPPPGCYRRGAELQGHLGAAPHRRQVCYGYHVYRRRHGRGRHFPDRVDGLILPVCEEVKKKRARKK